MTVLGTNCPKNSTMFVYERTGTVVEKALVQVEILVLISREASSTLDLTTTTIFTRSESASS